MRKIVRNQELDFSWQFVLGFIVLIIVIIIYYQLLNLMSSDLAYSWVFGLIVGFTLQRSRICFTAALRDPFLFGLTELARAIILSLMITTIGVSIIQYYQSASNLLNLTNLDPIGWNIPIGAFIFGLGAAISGGCASGTLMRLGEGFQLQWVVFIGFILGSVHGGYNAPWWYEVFNNNQIIHLPSLVGWLPSVLIQISVLAVLYLGCYLLEKNKFSS